MFNAPFLTRIATCIAGCALALLLSSAARSYTIDVSLNVHYAIPSDVNSGGTWQIIAKSDPEIDFGIAGLNLRVTNINAAVVKEGPRGTVNGSDPAGFAVLDVFPNAGYRSLLITQEPAFAGAGEEESAFYGVGTIPNGMPGDLGPTFSSLTNLQDVPWATGDVFGESEWDTAAMFASGTFGLNVTPGFFAGSTGHVFSSIGTSTSFGAASAATITTTVRTNFMEAPLLPDYNNNGVVDAADYVLWRKGSPAADGNGDTFVDQQDYELWREHFGAIVGGGGAGSGFSGASVPEPASCVLLVFGLLPALLARRR